jgi:phospholipase/carboxylesterase
VRANEPQLNLDYIALPAPKGGGPGLLLLHGRGADEADLIGIVEALDPRLAVVSVRAPLTWGPGFAWYGAGPNEADTMRASLAELQIFVSDLPAAQDIDPQRLYLLGFSQGAVMSAALALTVSDQVRGVIMHSGYVPTRTGLPLKPEQIKDKPFFQAHGKYDDVLSVDLGRASRDYLASHGARLTYQEYPIGHTISEESLYDLSEWLTSELDNI